MLGKNYKTWMPGPQRRRKQLLDAIRAEIESYGYSLGDLTDSEIEEAVTYYVGPIERALPLSGKGIYWSLRRLSPGGRRLRGRRTGSSQRGRRPARIIEE